MSQLADDYQEASPQLPAFGASLRLRFDDTARERRLAEEGWIRDLRQYLGLYDPEVLRTLPEDGSRAFGRLTRTKVKSVDARMMDMLFPGGGDRNWAIAATPEPTLPDPVVQTLLLDLARLKMEVISQQLMELAAQGGEAAAAAEQTALELDLEGSLRALEAGQVPPAFEPTPEELQEAIQDQAKTCAAAMETTINDQLTEGQYIDHVRNTLHSGHVYGTGWFKGPLVTTRRVSVWGGDPQTGEWALQQREVALPYFEYVPIWDVFPDALSANRVEDLEGVFQRHVMTKAQVRKLGTQPGFDAALIQRYLRERPDGDAPDYLWWENDLREIRSDDQGTLQQGRGRRYEVIEYNGWWDGHLLAQCGVELPNDGLDLEYKACVWLLGPVVIKATLGAYDDDELPLYHAYYYEKPETGLYGTGLPAIMRDPQGIYNAALRALLDNLGLAAGPVMEANVDLLEPEELSDIRFLRARKVILRRGNAGDAQFPALRFYHIESRIAEFHQVLEMSQQLGDEATALPAYTHGEQDQGVARTVGGLSMLMGAANIVLKDPVRNFDDGITKPFIKAMYHWNMQFSDRQDIKGDYLVEATGSTSLVAKEVRATALEEFAQNTLNPADLPWIKRGELNRERARSKDLDADRLVYTDEEFKVMQQQQLEQQLALQAQASEQAAASDPAERSLFSHAA